MRIGVDLGGTKIEIIALNDNGVTVLRRRVPTPAGDYSATVRAIAELVRNAQSRIGVSNRIRIGAGSSDRTDLSAGCLIGTCSPM